MSTTSVPAPYPSEAGGQGDGDGFGAPGARPADAPFADQLARHLVAQLAQGNGGTITWLNHYSALTALESGVPVEEFDYLGLDGQLLCRLLEIDVTSCRTSADLLLPRLLEQASGLRIALIGSTPEVLELVAGKIDGRNGHRVVLTRDGYSGLPDVPTLQRELRRAGANLVIVGLGAPLQDFYALGLTRPGVLVCTCGGWLDQFSGTAYYPSWAYPLRLNWLVRLMREPSRMWRRYSVDAVRALRSRGRLHEYIAVQGARPLAAASPPVPEAATGLSAA